MLVLDAGARVTQLRFLPDGRLLVGTWAAGDAGLAIWPLSDGPVVFIPLPYRQVWDAPNRLAVLPSGDRLVTAFGGLAAASTVDGTELADGPTGPANEVIAAPTRDRFVTGHREPAGETVLTGLSRLGERLWQTTYPPTRFHTLAGFTPDGKHYLVLGSRKVTARSFAADGEAWSAAYPSNHADSPQLSPDGRHLGVMGASSLSLYDLTAPNMPRQIKGGSNNGNFVGFAFHPAGKTLAVIHGGPTLVKLYDLDTLTLRTKLNWKVGALTCVAFSADGQLGAVGTDDGRVVVWDVDE
ncbi:WD40 repeat domain-containing protein [bacterium]|nr:WD40 repeat domain-containing protein [bacterium]